MDSMNMESLNINKPMEDLNEEFNNFMYRVTEVNEIVRKMSSTDKKTQKIGLVEADQLLSCKEEKVLENLNDEDVVLNVKSNRTLINKRALMEPEKQDESTMSQEAFMASISKDADERYRNKLVRLEKMETFKKQATLAFRRGEFEKALCSYNKAIDQIKDSPLLYNNRCLTYMKLKLYERAIPDAETALKLNENCLRSYLFLAKAHYLNGNLRGYEDAIKEAIERNPSKELFIKEFIDELNTPAPQDIPPV